MTLVPSVGHGAVRDFVLGGERVAAASSRRCGARCALGFEAGARMLSFGLVYIPGAYADTDELVAVAEVAAEFGAPLVPHVRNEGRGVLEAVGEMIEVARRSGAPLHLSHLKSLADEALIEPLLELVEERRRDASTSTRTAPARRCSRACCRRGRRRAARRRRSRARADPRARTRIARDVGDGLPGWENLLGTLGPGADRRRRPRPLAELAAATPVETRAATCSSRRELAASMVLHYATDEAVRRSPRTGCSSSARTASSASTRIRALYGTAPRFLGRFVLREGLLPVEEAVARLTARAADRLGLADRGRIGPGKRADLVLLDPERYVDTATYEDPKRSPDGVLGVWVAGERVVDDGPLTGARPGGVLRRAKKGRAAPRAPRDGRRTGCADAAGGVEVAAG